MRETRIIMGMPVSVDIADAHATEQAMADIFGYFVSVDEKFSTYKETSEISSINAGKVAPGQYSDDMKTIFALSEETKRQSDGYFDIGEPGRCDPSGIVKGWAIQQAAEELTSGGFRNFFLDAGGDIQAVGCNAQGGPWRVGIRNPFNEAEIVKVLGISGAGVATSGTYARGLHVKNPKNGQGVSEIVSLTVIGPNIYEADRFATAAFAMGHAGIGFIERLPGFEGYQIDPEGRAVFTSGFEGYVLS